MFKEFKIHTNNRCEFIDITDKISWIIKDLKVKEGICVVFTPHTTAAVTINENADPSVIKDIQKFLDETIPQVKKYFTHLEGNSDAHIKSSLIGNSILVFIENYELKLGRWQGIYFCEFDGPRTRTLWLSFITTSR